MYINVLKVSLTYYRQKIIPGTSFHRIPLDAGYFFLIYSLTLLGTLADVNYNVLLLNILYLILNKINVNYDFFAVVVKKGF